MMSPSPRRALSRVGRSGRTTEYEVRHSTRGAATKHLQVSGFNRVIQPFDLSPTTIEEEIAVQQEAELAERTVVVERDVYAGFIGDWQEHGPRNA